VSYVQSLLPLVAPWGYIGKGKIDQSRLSKEREEAINTTENKIDSVNYRSKIQ